jgi:hypothetical protein
MLSCTAELIVETAACDLDERELSELRAYVAHLERTKRWRGRWHDIRATGTPCEECGLDLPRGARSDMLRHAHCRIKASRRRTTKATGPKRFTEGENRPGVRDLA